MFDWMGDFFKSLLDFVPKALYMIYASLACLLDVFQMALRKLAGLDVYFDPKGEAVSGDIVTNFIAGMLGIDFDGNGAHFDYSALSTVFWSMVLFGVIITFVSVFVALIKSHYNYDENAAKGPMQYVYAGLKSIISIAVVPIVVVLGLYVSQAVLTALDSITAGPTATSLSDFNKNDLQEVSVARGLAGNSQNSTEKTYIYYDVFGAGCKIIYGTNSTVRKWPGWDIKEMVQVGATTQTFSGLLFRAAAYNANRARTGHIVIGNQNIYGLEENGVFSNPKGGTTDEQQQALADMIDTAFACNLHLSDAYLTTKDNGSHAEVKYTEDGAGEWTSAMYFKTWFVQTIPSFTKFNIGAVWYYYDLWNFNFIVGFGALAVCVTLFINIILGLMMRIFMCIGLFLIAPPLFGLGPIDGGKARKGWVENFMKQVLMAYGAVIGMNIFFLIFPLINQIELFNIPIVDAFMQTIMIIVGLVAIKSFIAIVSGLVGGEDAQKLGADNKEEVGATVGKGITGTIGAAKLATLPGRTLHNLTWAGINKSKEKNAQKKSEKFDRKAEAYEAMNEDKNDLLDSAFAASETGDFSAFEAEATRKGLTSEQIEAMKNAAQNGENISDVRTAYENSGTDREYVSNALAAASARQAAEDKRQKAKKFAKKKEKRLDRAKGNGAEWLGSPLTLLGLSGVKDDKGVKAAIKTVKPDPDYAKETHEGLFGKKGKGGALSTMQESMTQMNQGQAQMNQSQAKLNQGLFGTDEEHPGALGRMESGIGGLRGDVSSGFTDMRGDISSGFADARHAIEDIRSDTQAINEDTAKMSADLDQVKSELADAKKDRADAEAKQDQIIGELAETKKEAKAINRNTSRTRRR